MPSKSQLVNAKRRSSIKRTLKRKSHKRRSSIKRTSKRKSHKRRSSIKRTSKRKSKQMYRNIKKSNGLVGGRRRKKRETEQDNKPKLETYLPDELLLQLIETFDDFYDLDKLCKSNKRFSTFCKDSRHYKNLKNKKEIEIKVGKSIEIIKAIADGRIGPWLLSKLDLQSDDSLEDVKKKLHEHLQIFLSNYNKKWIWVNAANRSVKVDELGELIDYFYARAIKSSYDFRYEP